MTLGFRKRNISAEDHMVRGNHRKNPMGFHKRLSPVRVYRRSEKDVKLPTPLLWGNTFLLSRLGRYNKKRPETCETITVEKRSDK